MLNLFSKKTKNLDTNLARLKPASLPKESTMESMASTRNYPPATSEWSNSIYTYNEDSIKALPIVNKTVNKLIKSYFNLSPLYKNKKSSRVQVRFKRLSLNRILVSRAEMKHTNNKVIITVYLYNKNKKFFIYKLKKVYKSLLFKIFAGIGAASKGKRAALKKLSNLTLNVGSPLVRKEEGLAFTKIKETPLLAVRSQVNPKIKEGGSSSLQKGNAYKTLVITNLRTSKFSSKRLKKNNKVGQHSGMRLKNKKGFFYFIKTNYYINYTNLTKKDLYKFLAPLVSCSGFFNKTTSLTHILLKREVNNKIKQLAMQANAKIKPLDLNNTPLALKTKYKGLIKKYYFLLSKEKALSSYFKTAELNTINKDYYLNYVNLAKTGSSVNTKKDNLSLLPAQSTFFNAGKALKKNTLFSTKRSDNYCKLLNDNNEAFKEGLLKTKRSVAFFNTFALNKTRKPRMVKNFLYKLRNLHKLFFISKMYNNNVNNIVLENQKKESVGTYFFLSEKRNFLLKNLHKILKDKSTNLLGTRARANRSLALKKRASASASASNAFAKKINRARKINYIKLFGLRILKKARKNKNFILKTLRWSNKNFINYETKYYKKFINKSYRKEILYLYYVKMLSLNNNKFKNWFILGLKKIISKIYHKKVEFNFVNLKYLHLNSDIFSESIAIKLRNRENRLLKVLKKALKLVKLPSLNKQSYYDRTSTNNFSCASHNKFDAGLLFLSQDPNIKARALNKYETLNLNSYITMFKDKDLLHELLYKIFPRYMDKIENTTYSQRKNNLQEYILLKTKHKNIYGVRLEAQGRLSRRLTASRSVKKLKYKGSLKNIDSSYKNMSSVMLRGNTKSNIMLTKISSKTRNGAFGLKGWISSN